MFLPRLTVLGYLNSVLTYIDTSVHTTISLRNSLEMSISTTLLPNGVSESYLVRQQRFQREAPLCQLNFGDYSQNLLPFFDDFGFAFVRLILKHPGGNAAMTVKASWNQLTLWPYFSLDDKTKVDVETLGIRHLPGKEHERRGLVVVKLEGFRCTLVEDLDSDDFSIRNESDHPGALLSIKPSLGSDEAIIIKPRRKCSLSPGEWLLFVKASSSFLELSIRRRAGSGEMGSKVDKPHCA